jgi:hypothetical protein
MSASERFHPDPFDPGEPLGEVPPQEALQVLACEHDRAVQAPRPEVSLSLEDLERMLPPRDREVIRGWA